MSEPKILPLGETALLLESPPPVTLATQRRIWSIAARAAEWPHVSEIVPGMNNLMVSFDPLHADAVAIEAALRDAWEYVDEAALAGREVEIPVAYGGKAGPDLAEVARHTGLSIETVVARHTAGEYVVYFLGFQPGFAYLGGMDASLVTPRRKEPRLVVPAGSVAIGGAQTAIYPAVSPGGWQLIGHTETSMFDPARQPPTLLSPGDRVRFTAVSIES